MKPRARLLLTRAAILAATLVSLAGATRAAGDLPAVLPGWDGCKWNDPAHQTPKYMVGRIVAAFPHTPNGLKLAAIPIAKLFPGTKITKDGSDKIDIPCVGVIDMVVDSGGPERPNSGASWAWQVVEDKCGACNPNRCEGVSKTTRCGGGGSAPPGNPPGNSPGKSPGNPPGGGSHPDRSAVVAQAKADLDAAGHDLSGPCGAFSITHRAAWRMRGEGAGLLYKPGGNNCQGYAEIGRAHV